MNTRFHARVAALLCAGMLAACSTDQPGVTGPASADVIGAADTLVGTVLESVVEQVAPVEAAALTRKIVLGQDQFASATISPTRGGVLQLQPAGLTVVVPPGAVSRPTVIWAKARRGNLVAYEFGPHGTQFQVPITMTQDMKPTSWYSLLDRSALEVGYFKDGAQVEDASGRAQIDEFLPVNVLLVGNKVQFKVSHFSGYLLSTGRIK